MSVRALDAKSVSLLSATVRIPSFSDAVGELVWNAVESGAAQVRVTAYPSALRLLVVDDGEGISEASLDLLFQCGTSSKYQDGSSAGGFRGGALAALGSLASVEVRTRRTGGKLFRKWVRHGEIVDCGEDPDEVALFADHGTAVDVWELFHSVPVRKQELLWNESSIRAEFVRVRRLVGACALFNPQVAFDVVDGTKWRVLSDQARGVSGWIERICVVLGYRAKTDLCALPIVSENGIVVDGFASKGPVPILGWGDGQFVSVNGHVICHGSSSRSWVHKILRRAWKAAYLRSRNREEFPSRRLPAFVISVRFEDPAMAFKLNHYGSERDVCISDASEFQAAATHLFHQFFGLRTDRDENRVLLSVSPRTSGTIPELGFFARKRPRPNSRQNTKIKFQDRLLDVHTPLRAASGSPGASGRRLSTVERMPLVGITLRSKLMAVAPGWTNPCFPLVRDAAASASWEPCTEQIRYSVDTVRKMRVIGSVENKFIVAALPGSVHAIDQHAADERIRVEALELLVHSADYAPLATSRPSAGTAQVWLSDAERRLFAEHRPLVERYGWKLRWTEDSDVCEVLAVPCFGGLRVDDPSILQELLHELEEIGIHSVKSGSSRAIRQALATAACRSAVTFGKQLTHEEREDLLRRLSSCSLPFQCAHGRPSIVPLTRWDPVARHRGQTSAGENALAQRMERGLERLRCVTEEFRKRRIGQAT